MPESVRVVDRPHARSEDAAEEPRREGGTVLGNAYMLVFRTIHILGAIAWGGAIFLLVLFLQPTAKAVGPAAGPFMRELLAKRRLVTVLLWIAGTTIVAGAFLYWHDAGGLDGLGDFASSSFGVALTIGSISAIVAFLIGLFATKPTIDRTLAVGAQIAAAGDPPPPDLGAELQRLQARGRSLAKMNLAFVVVAALAMATARYW